MTHISAREEKELIKRQLEAIRTGIARVVEVKEEEVAEEKVEVKKKTKKA